MSDELFKKEDKKPEVKVDITDVAARLKILEERYNNLSKRGRLIEENMIDFEKDIKSDIKAFYKRLLEAKKHITEISEKIDIIMGDMSRSVTKDKLRVLEAYVDLWRPTDFITREEAEKLIKIAKNN